jgi:hypothetical protein
MKKQFSAGIIKARMVSPEDAARLFSTSPGTLANWRCLKKGPRFYKVNRKILYKVDDLEDFFTSAPVQTIDSLEGKN